MTDDLHCPGCGQSIVDVQFQRNEDGGRVSIEHTQPPCAWWQTAAAKQWAIAIVTAAITTAEAASA